MAAAPETQPQPLRVVPGKKGNKFKKWIWPGIFVLALAFGYIWWARARAGASNTGLVTTAVTRGDLVETISATGSVAAQTGAEVNIGSQITGVVKRLYTDVGSHVNKGDIIAQLDLPDLQATYQQSVANLQAASSKYQQDQSGLNQERVTTKQALATAQSGVVSAQFKLRSAQAALKEQLTGTPTDIRKAQTALASAKASLQQTQAGANLQIASANEQLTQAKANAANSSANLQRNLMLYQQGFIAATTYDQAKTTDAVNQSLVSAAQQNVTLTQQKVAADLQTASDTVAQAQAALEAANAETYTTTQRQADVKDAQAALDQANQTLSVAKANQVNDVLYNDTIAQAKDAAAAAQQQANYNQDQYQKSFIRSPISGTVVSLATFQGETVAAGLSAPTLIQVADLNRLEVDAYVDESDIGKVALGQPVSISLDAFPNQTINGTVVKVSAGSTIQQNVVTYEVTVSLPKTGLRLYPNMTATVTIQTGKISNVLLVPSVAVTQGTKGSTVNVVIEKNGKQVFQTVPVVTGGTDDTNTEIKKGLTEGETVVLAGMPKTGPTRGPSNPFGGGGGGGGGGRRGG